MLDLKLDRPGVTPKDAATIVLVRKEGLHLEVFCVERNKKSRFMGGAIVFPGGKLDDTDASDAWAPLVTAGPPLREGFADHDDHLRALAIAACRETLEEAAIAHVVGGSLDGAALEAIRGRLADDPEAFRSALRTGGMKLALDALTPLARWVTPEAEARRFDARFFVAEAPVGQPGAHDAHETMASFWARPVDVLARFSVGDIQLAPPTHRTLELLATCDTPADVVRLARRSTLAPVCPRLVRHVEGGAETLALALPGDPEHPTPRTDAPPHTVQTRYVLRGERWLPESR